MAGSPFRSPAAAVCPTMSRQYRKKCAWTMTVMGLVLMIGYIYVITSSTGGSGGSSHHRQAVGSGKSPIRPENVVLKHPREHVASKKTLARRHPHKGKDAEGERKAKSRMAQYCNPIESPTKGEEGRVAEGYSLKLVHAIIRHGARSARDKPGNPLQLKLSCKINTTLANADPMIQSYVTGMMKMSTDINTNQAGAYLGGLYPNRTTCKSNQLTGLGAIQHLKIGEHFANVYKDLMKDIDEQGIKVYSTKYPRTRQSFLALIYGLLPTFDLGKLNVTFSPSYTFCSVHMSSEKCRCPKLTILSRIVERAYFQYQAKLTTVEYIKKNVAKAFNLSPWALPDVDIFSDFLNVYICHLGQLPCSRVKKRDCVTWETIEKMWEYLDGTGAHMSQLELVQSLRRLTIHPLLVGIYRRMNDVIAGRSGSRFVVYSGHEATLVPLASTLGVFHGAQPRFAARIVIELYQGSEGQFFLRILQDGQDVTRHVLFCQGSLKDELCPFERFGQFVLRGNLKSFFAAGDLPGEDPYKKACA